MPTIYKMKKITKITFLAIALIAFSVSTTFAQKFGHVNSSNLLEMMPDTKAANTELEAYKKQLEKALEGQVKTFEAEVQDYLKKREGLAPVKAKELEEKLAKREQELYKERQEGEQKVLKKREELLKPIFEKADAAIKSVGKEGGYTMIFDSSTFNVLLFAEDSTEITLEVKAKLGL